MKEVLRRRKSNKEKGFTLVELIVVLVILVILIALLVPALTGYIDKSRRATVKVGGAESLQAAQTIASKVYGEGFEKNGKTYYGIFSDSVGQYVSNTAVFASQDGVISYNINSAKEMAQLVDMDDDYVCWVHFQTTGSGKIDAIMFSQDGYVAYRYMKNPWKVVKDPDNSVKPVTSGYVYFWDVVKKLFP